MFTGEIKTLGLFKKSIKMNMFYLTVVIVKRTIFNGVLNMQYSHNKLYYITVVFSKLLAQKELINLL